MLDVLLWILTVFAGLFTSCFAGFVVLALFIIGRILRAETKGDAATMQFLVDHFERTKDKS